MPLQSRRACPAYRPVLLLVLAAWSAQAVAQDELPGPALRPSPLLGERIAPEVRPQLPIFVEGDRISGRSGLDTSIEGAAVLRRGEVVIRADRLDYDQPEDLARAQGAVRVNRAGDVFEGPHLEMRLEAFEGFFTQPSYRFLSNGGHGQASRIDFLDADRAIIHDATYTTCVRDPGATGWPQWMLTADRIHIDNASETAFARGALVRFFGVPVLPVPALSFPLTDRRKSGFLTPNLGVDNRSGLEYTQPYYWNIAPNRDATLYPTVLSRRGVELGGDFRYLEPAYRGQVAAAVLPGDRLRDRDRWAGSLQHAQTITGLVPGSMSLGLQVNRVSDDDYWRDFSRSRVVTSLTQRLLANDGQLNWGNGPYAATLRLLKWQTLQDITAPIVPPYDRLPQLQGRYVRPDLPFGMVGYAEADFTRFESTPGLTQQPNAERSYLLARLARPWQAPGWFFTPRLQLHATQYQFDGLLADGRSSAQRTVPTLSLDSGLIFERESQIFGQSLIQTLEPRAFYVYTPFRNQAGLPNYDSGRFDFNFATIYTENAYIGHDRIADNQLLTLGLATRLQDPATGAELARGAIAQRLRFDDQRVVLPGEAPVVDRLSDVLIGGSINWSPHWTVDTTVQYNRKTSRSERITLGTRYNPTPYRVINAAYRSQRVLSEQLDVGWQWPINDLWGDRGQALGPGRGQGGGRWYSVGRLNYSLKDRRVVDSILGVEYDGCCWIGRLVVERLDAGQSGANKRILLQVEFLGLTRLGSNAIGAFRTYIPRYQFLREQVDPRSRFMNYE